MAVAIPQPLDSDHEDVHWALSTAQSLAAQGDNDEALRWLRKAVSAAVACRHDRRAMELGRWAAQFEDSLGLALTQRGPSAQQKTSHRETPRRQVATPPFDPEVTETDARARLDLDCPTHVDPVRSTLVVEDTFSDDFVADSEITLVPFTMKAAQSPKPSKVATERPAVRRVAQPGPERPERQGARTLQVAQFPSPEGRRAEMPPFVDEPDESTLAMSVAPNAHEIADHDSHASTSAAGIATVPRHRVALVASPDGHDPRVLPLARGATAPTDSGVAILIPVSSRDAHRIAELLGLKP
jgi:hypothetical protein